jgi:hypothetical protein
MGDTSAWNSLEVVKLVVGLLTPALILVLGVVFDRRLKTIEQQRWASNEITKKRLQLYDQLLPQLNDLMCFFTYVGDWKKTPSDVTRLKRSFDRDVYLAAPLLSMQFFEETTKFMDGCFSTYNDWGEDARLRSKTVRRKAAFGTQWDSNWEARFSPVGALDPEEIRALYESAVKALVHDIGLVEPRDGYGPPVLSQNVI